MSVSVRVSVRARARVCVCVCVCPLSPWLPGGWKSTHNYSVMSVHCCRRALSGNALATGDEPYGSAKKNGEIVTQ